MRGIFEIRPPAVKLRPAHECVIFEKGPDLVPAAGLEPAQRPGGRRPPWPPHRRREHSELSRDRKMVRTAGLEPAWAFAREIFVPTTTFAAASSVWSEGRLWSGLSLHLRNIALGAARLVSTPSNFRWLGSGLPFERFPRI